MTETMTLIDLRRKAENAIKQELYNRHPDFPRTVIDSIVLEYIGAMGPNSVADLYGWLLWARANETGEPQIWADIMHDINGRHNEWVVPRTAGYAKEQFKNVEGLK